MISDPHMRRLNVPAFTLKADPAGYQFGARNVICDSVFTSFSAFCGSSR
jgi:hypothetical protein